MIITFTGFMNETNKSNRAIALASAMCSLTKGTKTLVLQLCEKDVEPVEHILTGVQDVKAFVDKGLTFTNEGIDGLLRVVDTMKLNKEDFDQMCLSLRKENRLDIAEMTKNSMFVNSIPSKLDSIKQILRNATEVYDDIFVLLPSKNEEVIKEINELEIVDRCVYCMNQGTIEKGNVYGYNPVVLLMDYDEDSMYTLRHLRSAMKLGKHVVTRKIRYSTKAKDAALSGQLLGFIAQNRDLDQDDTNYYWLKDVKEMLADLLGVPEGHLEPDYAFEKLNPVLNPNAPVDEETMLQIEKMANVSAKEKESFFKKAFAKKK